MSKSQRLAKKKQGATRPAPKKTRYEQEEDIFERQQNKLAFGLSDDDSDGHVSEDGSDYETVMDLPSSASDQGEEEFMDDDAILDSADSDAGSDGGDFDEAQWGRKRQTYYDADRPDDQKKSGKKSSKKTGKSGQKGEQPDVLAEEAAEAARLQRKRLEALRSVAAMPTAKFSWSAPILELKPIKVPSESSSNSTPSSDVKSAAFLSDLELASELKEHMQQVHGVLAPLLRSVSHDPRSSGKGLDFVRCKYHLLGNYCAMILRYLQYRAGKATVPRELQDELVRHRLLLEKLRPVEQRLQHQIDALVQAAKAPAADSSSSAALRPGVGTFSSDDGEEDEGEELDGEAALYKAPRNNPVSFEDGKRKQRRVAFAPRGSDESGEEPEMVEPLLKAPRDQHATEAYEEDNFVRFTLSRKDKAQQRDAAKLTDDLDDLESFMDTFDKRHYAKKDVKLAKGRAGDVDEEIDSDDVSEHDEHRDSSAKQGGDRKQRRQEKRQLKLHDRHASKPVGRGLEDLAPGADRPASRRILENRGLRIHRNKDIKNPRVKQRRKFERAVRRLPSQHATHKRPGRYGGEGSGIRTDISRSTKF